MEGEFDYGVRNVFAQETPVDSSQSNTTQVLNIGPSPLITYFEYVSVEQFDELTLYGSNGPQSYANQFLSVAVISICILQSIEQKEC